MPSPFPGMDPFLELGEWEDFHTTFNTIMRELLAPQLGRDYHLRVERRVYIDQSGDEPDWMTPDVFVTKGAALPSPGYERSTESSATPVQCAIPLPVEREEVYLVLRDRPTDQVVTVIETLSPSNKRPHSDGQAEYLRKRQTVVRSDAHFVELDLLRGGESMPIHGKPPSDYYVMVSRSYRRPIVEVYAWNLPDALPTIDIPLKRNDKDVTLPLQHALELAFARAQYERVLRYDSPLVPALAPDMEAWVQERLATR